MSDRHIETVRRCLAIVLDPAAPEPEARTALETLFRVGREKRVAIGDIGSQSEADIESRVRDAMARYDAQESAVRQRLLAEVARRAYQRGADDATAPRSSGIGIDSLGTTEIQINREYDRIFGPRRRW
jgi:hypothetical protein